MSRRTHFHVAIDKYEIGARSAVRFSQAPDAGWQLEAAYKTMTVGVSKFWEDNY